MRYFDVLKCLVHSTENMLCMFSQISNVIKNEYRKNYLHEKFVPFHSIRNSFNFSVVDKITEKTRKTSRYLENNCQNNNNTLGSSALFNVYRVFRPFNALSRFLTLSDSTR